MSLVSQIKALEAKRKRVIREIDAELAKLRVLCDHKNKQSYPSRGGESATECKDCGKWW
jgi:hypothetical protein